MTDDRSRSPMGKLLAKLTPVASKRSHILLASLMWTAVGATLLFVGVRWALADPWAYGPLLLVLAMLAGVLKGLLVLTRSARKITNRILRRGDGHCIGGFLSPSNWFLVLIMVVSGRFLRGGYLAHSTVGFIYTAIGTALLIGSVHFWSGWYRHAGAG